MLTAPRAPRPQEINGIIALSVCVFICVMVLMAIEVSAIHPFSLSVFMLPSLFCFPVGYVALYDYIAGYTPHLLFQYDHVKGFKLNEDLARFILEAVASFSITFILFALFRPMLLASMIFSLCTLVYFAIRLNYLLQPARDERAAHARQKEADELQKERQKEADERQLALEEQRAIDQRAAEQRALEAQRIAIEQQEAPRLIIQGLISQKSVIIGTLVNGGLPIYYRGNERFRNTYVIGSPDSGKTTCEINLIAQDMCYGNGVIVLAAERDMFEKLLPYIPKERMDDLIYFQPEDLTSPIIGFNPFTRRSDENLNQKIGETRAIIKRAMGNDLGVSMVPMIDNAVSVLVRRPSATFADLLRLLNPANKTIRNPLKNDPTVDEDERDFWKQYDESTYYRSAYGAVYNRFNRFAQSPISTVLATSSFSFKDVLNSGRSIIFLDLSQLRDTTLETMGQMLLATIEQALLSRNNIREADRIPYYLYIDEFQKYATGSKESLISLFNGARKYKLGITIAHQTTANIPPELMETIHQDTTTKIVMHLEVGDARIFAPMLGIKKAGRDSFDPEVLQALKTGQSYVRTPTETIGKLSILPADPVVPLPISIASDVKIARSKENFGQQQNVLTVEVEEQQAPSAQPEQPQEEPRRPFGITFD